ncbi:MAG: hypothetical protein KDA24_16370 [Deltaproteobacteria bacterium]|nr:hypothetical protein [Deltaproteobacteria bacterium]
MKLSPEYTSVVGLLGAGLLMSCSAAEGLRVTPEGTGPGVVIDWDAEPLPEIPFPNDLALRIDTSSPTGLRLNLSEDAPTEMEQRARRLANEATGFGIYAPITVRFDAPLNLDVIAQLQADDGDFGNDAIYVIDVTEGSPTYLQPARLDLGHGRFPGDLFRLDQYFTNDFHDDVPSLLFDTHDEDINGNGLLDPGEDVDGDHVLDKPNVYPEGGDAREDLLTWYERETDTLIVRPVLPLREQTTYAVVVTERLVGLDGEPVRSPWEYINHTRQTEAIQPALEALPNWNVGVDNIAFTWSFTTGRVTGELMDIRRALDGEGPFAHLLEEVPPSIDVPLQMHQVPEITNIYRLPISRIIGILGTLGLFPEESRDALLAGYEFAEVLVGGEFTVPWFLVDTDDGGRDTSDDTWQVDSMTGEAPNTPTRVAFTCLLPKEDENVQQPYDVANYGHGYGSSRVEFLGFAWAFSRIGGAVCSFDYPGHGLELDDEDLQLAIDLLEVSGLSPILEHLEHDRDRDLDNSGADNSGGDMWTSDGFHTRDMVRQAAVDHLWFAAALRNCGTGSMGDVDGDGVDEVTCDWDANGVPDIGGPDVDLHLLGGSLGGINTAVTAGVAGDTWTTISPIVAGAGLMDVGWRSALGGVREALVGRLTSPFFVGVPNGDGTLAVSQVVNSVKKMRTFHVGTLTEFPENGLIRVENLANGEVREREMPADGRFRIAIPADAARAADKRLMAGIPDTGPIEGVEYEVANNEDLGDLLRISFFTADGAPIASMDTFETDVVHEGVTMRAGSPLVAGGEGLGHIRGTPRLRRLVNVLSMVTEPADPISYARNYVMEPPEELGGEPLNILLVPTTGDEIVPVAAEYSLARAAGFWSQDEVDDRYGTTVDRWLIDVGAIRGDERWGPWEDDEGNKVLFDIDDADEGLNPFDEPSEAPLRVTIPTSTGVSGMRVPYVRPEGTHAFTFPNPSLEFDVNTYSIFQIANYARTRGQELTDDLCFEDLSCSWMRPLPEGN